VQSLSQTSAAIGTRDARRRATIAAVLLAAVGLVLGGTLLLWAHYGTAVFFEMVAAGIAACF
jgi:hypothetical protein